MTDKSHLGRSAQAFEELNAPEIFRDKLAEFRRSVFILAAIVLSLASASVVVYWGNKAWGQYQHDAAMFGGNK
jgi:hypothetical protein